MTVMYGLITGVIFGVLLQQARVIRYDKQLGALRLKDMTIVKYMLSTVIVAMIGVYLLLEAGEISLSVKGLSLGGQIIGGTLFGIGWALLGYCPGTAMGALGEGRFDAAYGIAGGWVGAALYAEFYPAINSSLLSLGKFGKLTLPAMLGISHWVVIAVVVALFLGLFAFFEKKGL